MTVSARTSNNDLKAFLLTRDWRDTQSGLELRFWASSDAGPIQIIVEGQKAVCFILRSETYDQPGIDRKPVHLKTLDGQDVDALYFSKQRDLQGFINPSVVPRQSLYETDIRPPDRYLMERFIQGPINISGNYTNRAGTQTYVNPRLTSTQYRPRLNVASIDIETNFETDDLYSVGIASALGNVVFMRTPPGGCPETNDFNLVLVKTEADLLTQLLKWIADHDPDVIIGWNVIGFDLKLIEKKCQQHGMAFNLGRNHERAQIIHAQGASQMDIARVPGRVIMDGIESLRAAFYNFENFSLDFVANELLGRGKLIHDREDAHRGVEIQRQYQNFPVELARYNLEDCKLVIEIFEHTKLLDFTIERAASTGLATGRVGGSVAAFDFLYLPRLHRKGFVAPDPPFQDPGGLTSPGGYVLDSEPGLYNDVLVLDFKSLYPSIILTFLIDPYGMWNTGENPVEGFQGAHFSRNDPILPEIIKHLWERRDQAKLEKNAALSQAVKIIMNSFYGVLGTSACRFYDTRLTSSITRRGHDIILRSQAFIESQGHRVIYGDTDSLFVWLREHPTPEQARATGSKIAKELNQWWINTIQTEHNLKCQLEIEFETHYLKFLMPTVRGSGAGSKKRYAGMIQGKDQTELIFKGLETVRTDWTPLAREFQYELFRRIFNNEGFEDLVKSTHQRLLDGQLNHKTFYRKRIRQSLELYVRNVPPHVQAARKLEKVGKFIEYAICTTGPEPKALFRDSERAPTIDYEHYADRQLKPVADTILNFLDTSFDEIIGGQMEMFSSKPKE